MKKFTKILCVLLGTVMLSMPFAACADKGKTEGDQKPPVVVDPEPKPEPHPDPKPDPEPEPQPDPVNGVTLLFPKKESTVSIANELITKFSENYVENSSEQIIPLDKKGTDVYASAGLILKWTSAEKVENFTLTLSTDAGFKAENTMTYQTAETQMLIPDLTVSTQYYWNVCAADKPELKSETYSFTTAQTPRTIFIDGVSNTRDIGGYLAEGGERIRQGVVYRGGLPDSVSAQGITQATEKYGIRTELDLRDNNDGKSNSFGSGVKYVRNHLSPYYVSVNSGSIGIDVAANYAALKKELLIFADSLNFPVYFHCSLGRDKTGTLSLILLALCGVSEQDIYMDYELSYFSQAGSQGSTIVDRTFNAVRPTIEFLKSQGETLSLGCEKFLTGKVGLTAEQISQIKGNLLVAD